MKANLIKRPGIENPIYQTTLEIFPSAIFSNIIFASKGMFVQDMENHENI